jgi:hypothetical protein
MRVATPDGHTVPFCEVARLVETRGPAAVRRVDQRRAVVITADVDQRENNAEDITADLLPTIAELERNYPGDYVFEYIEGNDQDFDYGIDYVECASCKFFEEQGVPELSPYFCAKDKIASEFFGWGLSRSQTLAEGGERCDFRFKKGGKTNLIIPPSLRQTSTD